jgi:DnaJ-class molecular chaperone
MTDPTRSGSGGSHDIPPCSICGGDGRISNAFGLIAKCPSCHGSGRRSEDTGFYDVTKTKASHKQPTNRAPTVEKQTWPGTAAGALLATEIRDASKLTADVKARLTREIIDHEIKHGQCTQTFLKKVRKQVRPAV